MLQDGLVSVMFSIGQGCSTGALSFGVVLYYDPVQLIFFVS